MSMKYAPLFPWQPRLRGKPFNICRPPCWRHMVTLFFLWKFVLKQPFLARKVVMKMALGTQDRIWPFLSEDEDEYTQTVTAEHYIQVLHKFWALFGHISGLDSGGQWCLQDEQYHTQPRQLSKVSNNIFTIIFINLLVSNLPKACLTHFQFS